MAANQIMSESADLLCGVPRGLVLGPLLFLLYIIPQGKIIKEFSDVDYHLFAGNIQLYCSFKPSEIQKLNFFNVQFIYLFILRFAFLSKFTPGYTEHTFNPFKGGQ